MTSWCGNAFQITGPLRGIHLTCRYWSRTLAPSESRHRSPVDSPIKASLWWFNTISDSLLFAQISFNAMGPLANNLRYHGAHITVMPGMRCHQCNNKVDLKTTSVFSETYREYRRKKVMF